MWISEPTPVISSTKLIESWSVSRPMFTCRPATGIYENRCWSWLRWPAPSRGNKAITAATNEAAGGAAPSSCPHRSVRRPPSSRTAAPKSGKASSSQDSRSAPVAAMVVNVVIPSVLQQVGVVDRRRPAGPEDRHQDREADHHPGGGHHHHEERDDLPVQVAVHPGERDERQVARVQHQLYAHEHDDGVAPHQHADGTDHEQDHGQGHVVDRAHESALPVCPDGAGSRSLLSAVIASGSFPGRTICAASVTLRGASTGLTDRSEVVPSGSRAGRSAASCSAYTPGDGSGAIWPLASLRPASTRCVGRGTGRSRCASTIAPSAAVMSSAPVTSNGNT